MKELLGERIKHYRKLSKLSQRALASNVEVHFQTIAGWEAGRSWPEYDKLVAIAHALKIDVERLFETIGKTAAPQKSHTVSTLTKLIEEQEQLIRNFSDSMDLLDRVKKHRILSQMVQLSDEELSQFEAELRLLKKRKSKSVTKGIDKIEGET